MTLTSDQVAASLWQQRERLIDIVQEPTFRWSKTLQNKLCHVIDRLAEAARACEAFRAGTPLDDEVLERFDDSERLFVQAALLSSIVDAEA